MTDDTSPISAGSRCGADANAARHELSRREIWIRLLLYPTHTLPTAAAPVFVAVGLAIRDHVFAPWPAALALLGSWLIHIAGVFADNHELLRTHADIQEHPELLQALQSGTLRLRDLRIVISACLVAAILCGAYLITLGGTLAFAIGVVGVAASLGYAGAPFAYARTGLAEPIFLLMFGVVAVAATYYIQVAASHGVPPGILDSMRLLSWQIFVVGLPVGAMVTNVLIIDDIRDISFDTAKGWRTGAVRFGIGWSRTRFVLLYVLAYLAPIAFLLLPGYGVPILLPLLTLPLALSIALKVCAQSNAADLLPQTPRASILALAYAILLAVGLALG